MKVLVISHNCFSTTQNMGKTLLSLFSEFCKDELMQLYFHPATPNLDVCDSYYRITDKEALRSVIKRKSCGGTVKLNTDNVMRKDTATSGARKVQNKSFFARRVRDAVWSLSAWKNGKLKRWLIDGRPDAVFLASGDATFSQDIAIWAARFLDIPLITYFCDEYYFYHKGFFGRALTSNIKKTIKASEKMVTICEDLGKVYEKKFGTPYTSVMTGSSFVAGSLEKKENVSKQVSYIGNLALNRWKSLLDVAEVINALNEENSEKYKLVYYGSEKEELKDKVAYGGRLDAEGVKKAMAESFMLVHVETFDEEYRARLMYSVSTKIADSLASGKCMLAYGPKDFASMQHLINNNCCVFAENKKDLKENLKTFLLDVTARQKIEKNAIEAATAFHNSKENSKKLYSEIKTVVASYEKNKF